MSEELNNEGHLTIRTFEEKKLRLRMEGLRDSIRELLDPFENLAALRVDVAAEQMIELAGLQADLKETIDTIALIKKKLGR